MGRTILVTGASGLLAPYLVEVASQYGNVVTTSRSYGDELCDLSSSGRVGALLEKVKAGWIIHAAAMTDVDACESNPAQAQMVNAAAVENIVARLGVGVHLAFVSTDQVYPDTAGLHCEGSEAPVNVYGSTKLEGERLALSHQRAVAFRANLFGSSRTEGRSSLDDFVVDGLTRKKSITVFEDVLFSPLHMSTLAEVICEGLERELCGVYNTGCREGMSKAQFAFSVADHLNLNTETAVVGRSSEFAYRARRPLDLRMDVSKLETVLGRAMPTLEQEIKKL